MGKVRFATLLGELPEDEEEFVAAHPAPALILEPFTEDIDLSDDVHTLAFGREQVLAGARPTGVVAVARPARPGGLQRSLRQYLHPDATAVWLVAGPSSPLPSVVSLGRGASNDIAIRHSSISRTHALFHCRGDAWLIEDDGSHNGTFLDGERLPVRERVGLPDGASLRLGDLVAAKFFAPHSLFRFCRLMRSMGGAPDAS